MFLKLISKKNTLLCILFLFLETSLSANVIYVNINATGANNGTSWTNAYTDLQNAINNAVSGDEIWVAKGTYYPNRPADNLTTVNLNNRNNSFVLKDNVNLYGGFLGNETLLAQRDWNINPTVLSGDIGVSNLDTDNCYHVVVGAFNNQTEKGYVDGFRIIKGYANGTGITVNNQLIFHQCGGGIFFSKGELVLKNTKLENNYAYSSGAGIFLWVASINANFINVTNNISDFGGGGGLDLAGNGSNNCIMNNFTFYENTSVMGGGINITHAKCEFRNGTLIKNTARHNGPGSGNNSNSGGGIKLYQCKNVMENLTLDNNSTLFRNGAGLSLDENEFNNLTNIICVNNNGEAIYIKGGDNKLDRLTVQNNLVGCNAGGIYLLNSTNTKISNTIIQGNKGADAGSIYILGSNCEIYNSLITGNEGSTNFPVGGISILFGTLSLKSCTLSRNHTNSLSVELYSNISIENSIIENNNPLYSSTNQSISITANNSCIPSGSIILGNNNISLDPLFINPLPSGLSTGGDYRLQCNSPCIDSGNNSYLNATITTDLDNNNRIIGINTDMGAYEFNGIQTPTLTSNTISYCLNQTATPLSATGTNLLWYTSPTGVTGSITAPTPNTTVAGTTNYYVSQTISGCESPRAAITVTVNPLSATPTVSPTVYYCQNQSATPLTATGTNLLWYTNPIGGTGSVTAPIPNTSIAGTTTYYVTQNTNGCESSRASIVVTVGSAPAAPMVVSPIIYCQNQSATALTATGTALLWYTSASGGTGNTTAPVPNTSVAGTTTYYVTQTVGCESVRSAIQVVVNATPSLPSVTVPPTYCLNQSATPLSATGTNLLWYTSPTGGTGSITAPTPNTTVAGTTNYYVSQTISGCESPRAAITVTVNPLSATPTVSPTVYYCQNQSATPLTATGTNLLWYTNPIGGTGSITAPIPNTSIAGTTTYYVTQNTNGCESSRASIVVTVGSAPAAPMVVSPIIYCQNQSAAALTATGTALLWYTSATGGTGNTTAPVPNTSVAGTTTYYVTQTVGCESVRNAIQVTINPLPDVSIIPETICEDHNGNVTAATLSTSLLNNPNYSFEWYSVSATGNLQLIGTGFNVSVNVSGAYGVIVKNNTTNCSSDLITTTVSKEYQPFSLVVKQSDYFDDNTSVEVMVTPVGNYQYQLDQNPFQISNIFERVSPGNHTITVFNGCGTLSKDLVIINYPKFFTPNNDGYNDTWNIQALKNQTDSFIEIFDRFGKLLKVILPSSIGWDGTYLGQPLPSSDYWFVVHYLDTNNNPKTFKSHFTLKR